MPHVVELFTPTPDGFDGDAWVAACGAVRDFCGWHVWPEVTETVKVRGVGRILVLPTLRLTAIESVTNDGHPVEVDPLDWSEDGVIEVRYGSWSTRRSGVQVTMTHGFDACPDAVMGVLRSLALAGDGSALTQSSSGPHSATWDGTSRSGASALSNQHKATLAPYRLGIRP